MTVTRARPKGGNFSRGRKILWFMHKVFDRGILCVRTFFDKQSERDNGILYVNFLESSRYKLFVAS